MSPSHSRHHPSIKSLVTDCHMTDNSPVIFWQTRKQRDQQDMAGHLGSDWERSRQAVQQRGHVGLDSRRTVSSSNSSYSKGRTEKYNSPDLRVEHAGLSRQRFKSPPGRRRGLSCSRIRSYSRGRSRSPRRTDQPGPGILKGRSATHDGRKREGGVGWKMFRISRVDQVREFSPWPEERVCEVDGQDVGKDRGEGNHEEVESSFELKPQLGQGGEKEKVDEEQAEGKHSAKANVCRRNVKKIKMTKRFELRVADIGVDIYAVNKKSASQFSVGVEAAFQINAGLDKYDGNNNEEFSEINVAADATENFHGFDPQDRNPHLLSAVNYESLIDEIESEAPLPIVGHLQVVFPHHYQSRSVQCRHTDCPTTSLPTTLGLLPLPQSGQHWLCTDHSQCLLCKDSPSSGTCVLCTMCARVYHTHHLDMDTEFQDKLEMELFICKLCSDPGQFTQLGTVVENYIVPQSSSKSLQPHKSKSSKKSRPNHPHTKIKPIPVPSGLESRGRSLQHDDPTLPPGWYRQLVKSGDRWRVVITGPDGRRFWSKSDLRKAFRGEEGKGDTQWKDFDFSVFGSKGQQ